MGEGKEALTFNVKGGGSLGCFLVVCILDPEIYVVLVEVVFYILYLRCLSFI